MFNWTKEPKFQEAVESGVNELTQRVLKAVEFSAQIDSVNSMLDYEAEALDALDVREAIIRVEQNQEKLRVKIQAIIEEVELLK